MNKTILVLLIVLLSGAVLWLASRPDFAGQTMPGLPGFDPAEVADIHLDIGKQGVVRLVRTNGQWYLVDGDAEVGAGETQLPANADAVNRLLGDLANMHIKRVVSRNPKHYPSLRLDQEATHLILKGGDDTVLLDMFVGKQGSDLISTYIRINDANEVLAVDRALLWQVNRSAQGWKAAKPASADDHDASNHDASNSQEQ